VFAFATVLFWQIMAEKQNSAFRLYRFIEKMVPQQPPNQPTADVLLKSFGVDKSKTSQREQNTILARVVLLLFNELELLLVDLRRAGRSEESIRPIVKPFDSLSGGFLAIQWSAFSPAFAASLPVLLLAAETLPEDGATVSQEELSELSKSIEKLRIEVRESTLPDVVKNFVFEQLNIIARAVADYPLAGVNAFKSAVRDAIFHLGEHSEVVEVVAENPAVMSGLKQIQETAVKYAKYTMEVSKFIGALDILYHHAQAAPAVAHQLSGLIQHVVK
jgi:hypothetical protein